MKQIINCETGEVLERDFNEEELAQSEIDAKMVAETQADGAAKLDARSALLERLGITSDEAGILFG